MRCKTLFGVGLSNMPGYNYVATQVSLGTSSYRRLSAIAIYVL